MNYFLQRFQHSRHLFMVAALTVTAVLIVGITSIVALPNDGRINLIHHFGGDALYCVDANLNATNEFSDVEGLRLLNQYGEVLWYLPFTDITLALDKAQANGGAHLAGSGMGTYGPVSIFVWDEGSSKIMFEFSGYDEHGKLNRMTFSRCNLDSVPPQDAGNDQRNVPFSVNRNEPPAPAETPES